MPGVGQDLRVLGAVEHHLGAVVALVGDVEPERLEAVDRRVVAGDLHERRLGLRGPRREQPGAQRQPRDELPSMH